jgi:uracil-DNA glycosylase family 4
MSHAVKPQMPSSIPTRIAFVADAPRFGESVPMTGTSGALFNAMLRSANLERDDFFIGNVFDTVVDEESDIDKWMKDDVRVCENMARLNEQLQSVQPTVIVPLGATALWAFTGQTLIAKYRGAVTPATNIMAGHKLLPTYHPAAIQKNWIWLSIVVGDLIKANAEAELGPKIVYPHVELLIEPTVQDVLDFIPECKASPKLSVDIETGWGQITAISFAPTTSRAMSVPFVDLRKPNRSYWPTVEAEWRVWRAVEEILGAPNPKVGQNYTYDLVWLYDKHGIATRNYRSDTRLRHKVLYSELPADLANMAASYTRIGAYKTWGGRYQNAVEKKDG